MTVPLNPDHYVGKKILAPMVKIGTLASRVLAIRYGADLVYSEEIIDWRFLRSRRVFNEVTQTVDYIDDSDGRVIFQTCDEEKGKLVLQIGTCDPERALRVANHVRNDISGIDINMGCPKEFSLKGGMGAALLKQPEKIKAILTILVSSQTNPVTCKIRVFNNLEDTLTLCKIIEECGVSAIAIHGRTKDERPQHSNRNHFLKEIASNLRIPVIANGCSKEISKFDDIEKLRECCGCSSIMIARAAERNPSIFSPNGKEDLNTVIQKFLRLAVLFDNPFTNTKYTIQNMLRELQETSQGRKFLATQTMEEICALWDLSEFYEATQREFQTRRLSLSLKLNRVENYLHSDNINIQSKCLEKKRKLDDSPVIVVENCVFIRGHYPDVEQLPKTLLLKWCRINDKKPIYKCVFKNKKFQSTVTIEGQVFQTDVWEKSKKFSEQGAALACIKYLKFL